MNYIQNFKPEHYDFFIKKIDVLLGNCEDLNCWLESLDVFDIVMWLKTTRILIKNTPEFEMETSMLLTLLITIFIKELNVANQSVELNNAEIFKIVNRFNKALQIEYAYKKKLMDRELNHSIIKDIIYH